MEQCTTFLWTNQQKRESNPFAFQSYQPRTQHYLLPYHVNNECCQFMFRVWIIAKNYTKLQYSDTWMYLDIFRLFRAFRHIQTYSGPIWMLWSSTRLSVRSWSWAGAIPIISTVWGRKVLRAAVPRTWGYWWMKS